MTDPPKGPPQAPVRRETHSRGLVGNALRAGSLHWTPQPLQTHEDVPTPCCLLAEHTWTALPPFLPGAAGHRSAKHDVWQKEGRDDIVTRGSMLPGDSPAMALPSPQPSGPIVTALDYGHCALMGNDVFYKMIP